jgi:polyferredoxin
MTRKHHKKFQGLTPGWIPLKKRCYKESRMNNEILRFCFFGMLLICGILGGRIFCGKACPAGYAQDLLFKIPFLVKIKTFKLDKPLRLLKYCLAAINLLLPLFGIYHKGLYNGGASGGAGNPIIVAAALTAMLIAVIIRRPFCKYLCPVGAFGSLFNKVSLYTYKVSNDTCNQCGLCARKCKMDINPSAETSSAECIRCGVCKKVCPRTAVRGEFSAKKPVIKSRKKPV